MSEDVHAEGDVLMDVTNTYEVQEVHGWLILSHFFVIFVGTGVGELHRSVNGARDAEFLFFCGTRRLRLRA